MTNKCNNSHDVISLLSDDDHHDDDGDNFCSTASSARKRKINVTKKISNTKSNERWQQPRSRLISLPKTKSKKISVACTNNNINNTKILQAGLVVEEDFSEYKSLLIEDDDNDDSGDGDDRDNVAKSVEKYIETQVKKNLRNNSTSVGNRHLYHDMDFLTAPESISGVSIPLPLSEPPLPSKSSSSSSMSDLSKLNNTKLKQTPKKKVIKCRCSPPQPAELTFSLKIGSNFHRPYHRCQLRRCKFFSWAFHAEMIQWYRFGPHTGHTLVVGTSGFETGIVSGFRADNLLQGKIGDCWFLSALAVVAQRPDLIGRLFGYGLNSNSNSNLLSVDKIIDRYGIVEVSLFVDGFWRKIVLDNFLPCHFDQKDRKDKVNTDGIGNNDRIQNHDYYAKEVCKHDKTEKNSTHTLELSKYDPFALSDRNRKTILQTKQFLDQHRFKKMGPLQSCSPSASLISHHKTLNLGRSVTSEDLAYSKAKQNQLWVPLLEKAYSKVHGCYSAISGGEVAEAFLDLTGAPTLVYRFDSHDFRPRCFWHQLMKYRTRRLPMGCGTNSSQVGILGMHAYSILDVREIRDVGIEFFKDKLANGTFGNVSGFTEFDGTVRLLRIRNPHGCGEWKGDFSDGSNVWESLLRNTSPFVSGATNVSLQRTMVNDGTFWIDYESFLMGFSNVDVVLAFEGNNAKSFASNFPPKTCNHRCQRVFEVSLIEEQQLGSNAISNDKVEVYVMCIQKTKRGARLGRVDRKKSYKVCDTGIIVVRPKDCGSEQHRDPFDENGWDKRWVGDDDTDDDKEMFKTRSVEGQMFGFTRNGHYRLVLERNKGNKGNNDGNSSSALVIPISFGHPAATDKGLSFVVRFVSDSPLLVRELPNVRNLRIDKIMQKFCLDYVESPKDFTIVGTSHYRGSQRQKECILDDSEGMKIYGEHRFKVFRLDCLANGGGTVLVYLAVNDDLINRSFRDNNKCLRNFNVTLSIEATCRGMFCRTDEGLLKYETVTNAKDKQLFRASWRKYRHCFETEYRSRLLLVLVQSGQDTQMGSIKCKVTEKNDLSSTNLQSSMKLFLCNGMSTLLTENRKEDNYDKHGIFNGTKYILSNNHHFSSCSGKSKKKVVYVLDDEHNFDTFLDQASVLTSEMELQKVLKISKQQAEQQQLLHQFTHKEVLSVTNNYDAEIELAKNASLIESASSSLILCESSLVDKSNKIASIIDLTS